MKDRSTQRAVKNILHNELGITNEKVEQLITDYINTRLDKKFDDFLRSNACDYMINKRVDALIKPIIVEKVRACLNFNTININVK